MKEGRKKCEKHDQKCKRNFEKGIANGSAKDGRDKRKFFAYVKQRTKCRTAVGP